MIMRSILKTILMMLTELKEMSYNSQTKNMKTLEIIKLFLGNHKEESKRTCRRQHFLRRRWMLRSLVIELHASRRAKLLRFDVS